MRFELTLPDGEHWFTLSVDWDKRSFVLHTVGHEVYTKSRLSSDEKLFKAIIAAFDTFLARSHNVTNADTARMTRTVVLANLKEIFSLLASPRATRGIP